MDTAPKRKEHRKGENKEMAGRPAFGTVGGYLLKNDSQQQSVDLSAPQ